MKKNNIRLIIREILSEMEMAIGGGGWDSNNDISRFHGYPSGYGEFPHGDNPLPEDLPSPREIANSNTGYDGFYNNNEVYEFPFVQFKKGIEIEQNNLKDKVGHINLFDIAKNVIDNLMQDKNFYLKIESEDEDKGGM